MRIVASYVINQALREYLKVKRTNIYLTNIYFIMKKYRRIGLLECLKVQITAYKAPAPAGVGERSLSCSAAMWHLVQKE